MQTLNVSLKQKSLAEGGIIAQSQVMESILSQSDRIAATESTVLILGETGSGKELLANRIHQNSLRNQNHLIIVDPSTVPNNLFESELFGHEKGAFTGADRQKKGRLEMADGGTLFIDEVGEISKPIQTKLLRAIQEKTLKRVGGTQMLSSNFRLIAATNRNLAEEVAAGRFREDLYYRINVIPIYLPPLRERIEDISLLAEHFIRRYVKKYNKKVPQITPDDAAKLTDYHWPGNVRELKNIIERAVLLSTGKNLELSLPSGEHPSISANPFSDTPTLDEVQRRYIKYILEKTGGKISGPGSASEILGMKRTSLYNRMIKLGLR